MNEEEIEIIIKKDGVFKDFSYKKGTKYMVYKQSITYPCYLSKVYMLSRVGMSMYMFNKYIPVEDCLLLSELREAKLERVLKND